MPEVLPTWTALPFGALVLSMASLPMLLPHFWEKRLFQALVVALCTRAGIAENIQGPTSKSQRRAKIQTLNFEL